MERRLAAIMAADVVGYSRLMGDDEAGTLERLKALRKDLVQPSIAKRKGRVVKLMGDGLLAEFPSVVEAVQCAVDIQEQMAAREAGVADERRIRLRIGINSGDIIIEGQDIYGDGVNVAARLEGLAEPGGICISGKVHEEVRKRIAIRFADLGRREVKNIGQPVSVWHWLPGELPGDALLSSQPVPRALLDKASITVLPFANMSADPEQEYFSDGVTEDIITELSRFSELFVIARNSSFQFKGSSVDIREAARRLGAQYVMEGSVRKVGNRIRITAQLIDASSGANLWADRYDRQLEDIFEVQDDVVRAIVAILPGRIAAAGAEGSRRKPTSDMTAFDYLLRGNHVLARRGDSIRKAIGYYQKAIACDPEFAAAYAGIAVAEGMSVWDLSTYHDKPLERAYAAGKKALELDPTDYRSHAAFGEALRQFGEHALARHHLQRAMILNPNSARVLGYWAMLQAYTGDPKGAIDT